MKPLKIYLGDLTYDTITLSTETMPLNVGYLAAHCKEKWKCLDRFLININSISFNQNFY
jgi:hypothetical protein